MSNPVIRRVLAISTICTVGLPLSGCATTQRSSVSARSEIIAVVNGLFDAMHARDEAAMLGAFTEQVAMTSIDPERGVRTTVGAPDAFINSIIEAQGELIERMWNAEVRIDGDMATVWAPYDFHIGDTFSHCGYDAMQLVRSEGVWRIVSVAYTRRTEGCE